MAGHCWTVPTGDPATPERYVWAESAPTPDSRRTFPWLADKYEDSGDPTGEAVTSGGSSDGTAGPKHARLAEVLDWLRTYEGRSNFVLDVKHKVEHGRQPTGKNVGGRKAYRLTFRQVEALAKVKDDDEKRAKQRAELGTGLNLWALLPYGTTYAAAENERGTLSFVKMDKVERGNWADWVFVKAVIAGNEDMRLGSQRPDEDDYRGQWPVVLANVCRDVVAAVERFGKELGVCGVCNSPLTNEESRRLGIGPVCRSKFAA